MLAPVGRRHAPAIGFPGVGNLLVPAVVKNTASPVVVAQDAQPDLVTRATESRGTTTAPENTTSEWTDLKSPPDFLGSDFCVFRSPSFACCHFSARS